MRDASGFPARYNLIRLYRKAVHDSDAHENVGGSEIMLAMDYFDALEVDEFHSDTEQFSKFMGLSIYEDLTEHDVAMQSIPLYCPEITEKMSEEYCCHNSCFKDPFDKDSGEYRYFGMIQVYITPEILMRLNREHLKETEKDNFGYLGIYNAFFKDLHILMSDFVSKRFKEEDQGDFCYRVYQSMSVGDFVVAIRCNNPEVPFEVASMLRRRKYELERPAEHRSIHGSIVEKELCTNFVFYKTYTLMSLNTHIIPVSSDSEDAPDEGGSNRERKFVLRCVLSNKYWSNEKDVNRDYDPDVYRKISSYLRLNGRYDFTVTLSEQAFLYIHPKLVKYKIGSPRYESQYERAADLTDPAEKKICDDLESLMKDKYISYVNERFLFKDSRPAIEAGNYNDDIRLIEPEDDFLFANEINAGRLSKLADGIKCTCQRVLMIDTSRRSIVYSMRLLERIVSTCRSINGTSDSRIYCSLIIRQIEIVLEGANYYLSLLGIPDVVIDHGILRYDYSRDGNLPECSDAEYYDLIGALDSELKESLEYINSFAKFILDSSLQSLQTPHFNLETHVSVEKLLLSYSYFVQCFFEWYGQTETCKGIEGRQPFYYSLMVPQPMNTSLSTSTLFNWRIDETLKNRLLVVQCPSFSDLTHFSSSVGILMHEIAHSLRFEKRSERNGMILKYTSELLFDQVAANIVWDLRKKITGLLDYEFYSEEIRRCLTDAYEKHIGIALEDVKDKNFAVLTGDIEQRYKDFVSVIEYLSKLRHYLQSVLADYNLRQSPKSKNVMDRASEFYQIYFGENRNNPPESDYYAAYNDLISSLDEFMLADKKIPADDGINEAMTYLYDHLLNFDYYGSKDEIDEEFWKLCTAAAGFEREINRTIRKMLMDQRDLVNSRKIARHFYLGIYADLDGRERSFADYAESYIVLSLSSSLKFLTDMIDIYREVTSDLYMVKLLGLTPYGYLNFFTRNVPVDDIMAETYEKRFCMVLYALELEKCGSSHIDWERVWMDLYRAVCRHFLGFAEQYTDEKYKTVIIGEVPEDGKYQKLSAFEYLEHMGMTVESYMGDSDLQDMYDTLYRIAVGATAIKDSLDPGSDRETLIEQERFVSDLMHCRYLCSNLCSLIYDHRSVLESVTGFRYLADDLLRGARNLGSMHDEFKKSHLWKYCGRVSELYNEDAPEQTKQEYSNRLMTEFVLDMNYSMLYSNAFEITETKK